MPEPAEFEKWYEIFGFRMKVREIQPYLHTFLKGFMYSLNRPVIVNARWGEVGSVNMAWGPCPSRILKIGRVHTVALGRARYQLASTINSYVAFRSLPVFRKLAVVCDEFWKLPRDLTGRVWTSSTLDYHEGMVFSLWCQRYGVEVEDVVEVESEIERLLSARRPFTLSSRFLRAVKADYE
jgi:hypothetical protein